MCCLCIFQNRHELSGQPDTFNIVRFKGKDIERDVIFQDSMDFVKSV